MLLGDTIRRGVGGVSDLGHIGFLGGAKELGNVKVLTIGFT